MIPEDLKYTSTHEWVRVDDDLATVGITDYAQEELGDIDYLELPEVGATVTAEHVFGCVGSVSAVSDLTAPVSGEVIEVNEELADCPDLVNEESYGGGWMIIVKMEIPSEVEELLTPEQYENFVEEQ